MKRLMVLILSVIMALAAAVSASAQPPRITLEEIIVTATGVPTPPGVLDVTFNVINRRQWQEAGHYFVVEALENDPAVHLNQWGPFGAATDVRMRGGAANTVLLMRDGLRLPDSLSITGNTDMGPLSLTGLSRIEVIRGSQSVLWGSQAMSGVINLITRRGRGKPKLHLDVLYGGFNTMRLGVGSSGSVLRGRLRYALGLAAFRTDGISRTSTSIPKTGSAMYQRAASWIGSYAWNYNREDAADPTRQWAFYGNAQFDVLPTLTIGAGYYQEKTYAHVDGGVGVDRRDMFQTTFREQMYFDFEHRPLSFWRYKFRIHTGKVVRRLTQDWTGTFGLTTYAEPRKASDNYFWGRMSGWKWDNYLTFAQKRHVVSFGYAFLDHWGRTTNLTPESYHWWDWGTFQAYNWTDGNEMTGRNQYLHDYYVHYQGRFFRKTLFLRGGVRFTDCPDVEAGRKLTYQLGAAWLIRLTGTKLRANFATGFKVPSLWQLYMPPITFGAWGTWRGNAVLEPETSETFEIGLDQTLWKGRVKFSATLFHNMYYDQIHSVEYDPVNRLNEYRNVGQVLSQGGEFTLILKPHRKWTIKGALTLLDTKVIEWEYNPEYRGAEVLYTPRYKAHLHLQWRPLEGLKLNLYGTWQDGAFTNWMRQHDPNNPIARVGSWERFDFTATYRPPFRYFKHARFFLKFHNITGRTYQVLRGYNTLPRSIFFGVRITY
ncbi:MAG: TonB-dependent receptor [Proteobacteria bacterium]|nr:TonB-dependent receptor [Pseudomonadota bacterium]